VCEIPWQKEAKTVKKEGKKEEILLARTIVLYNLTTGGDEQFGYAG
jgi:hypothetical protein